LTPLSFFRIFLTRTVGYHPAVASRSTMSDAPFHLDPLAPPPAVAEVIHPTETSLQDAAAGLPGMPEDEVYLFHLRVVEDHLPDNAPVLSCLDITERERAMSMSHAPRRGGYLLCRAILRRLLAPCARVDPADLQFTRGPFGKPALMAGGSAPTAPRFNYSHSGQNMVMAFSRLGEIGVDVESPRERPIPPSRLTRMIQRFFHPDEVAWFARWDFQRLPELFPRFWTCKEAVVKAGGEGIQSGLQHFCVDPARALRGEMLHLEVSSPIHTPITLQNYGLKCGATSSVALCSKKKFRYRWFTLNV
jgi:4'-phosphopantetheinyl transferase